MASGSEHIQRFAVTVKYSGLTLVDDKLRSHFKTSFAIFRYALDNSIFDLVGQFNHIRKCHEFISLENNVGGS
jgi:hypothetical protein